MTKNTPERMDLETVKPIISDYIFTNYLLIPDEIYYGCVHGLKYSKKVKSLSEPFIYIYFRKTYIEISDYLSGNSNIRGSKDFYSLEEIIEHIDELMVKWNLRFQEE